MLLAIMAATLYGGSNCSTIHEAVEKSRKIMAEIDESEREIETK